MGPLALADFIGLDTCLAILRVLQTNLGEDKYRPCPLLIQYVDAGEWVQWVLNGQAGEQVPCSGMCRDMGGGSKWGVAAVSCGSADGMHVM